MRIQFFHPESDGKSSDVAVGGRIGILTIHQFFSTALLLNEVSNKSREIFETKFPKFAPKFAPKFFVLSWQVEKSSPKISPDFSNREISNFKSNSKAKFHQTFHKHTSAGLTALTIFCTAKINTATSSDASALRTCQCFISS